jgi:hypothetical protein
MVRSAFLLPMSAVHDGVSFRGYDHRVWSSRMPLHVLESLTRGLAPLFPGQSLTVVPLPEEHPASRTYVVTVGSDRRVFVKGTPRTIPEALTTAYLAAQCPNLLPTVLHPDLLPESDWHWFAMADAGECDRLTLTPDQACQAAYTLGVLQRTVQSDAWLAARLPSGLPHQLYPQALATGAWLAQHGDAEIQAEAQHLRATIESLAPRFHTLAQHLLALPPTCVHGDFWPGNLAIQADHMRLIDWAEAVWGVGGASIWSLLFTSAATLSDTHPMIWEAYGQGWQRPIEQPYIAAAEGAFFLTMLVIDQRARAIDRVSLASLGATLQRAIACIQRMDDARGWRER